MAAWLFNTVLGFAVFMVLQIGLASALKAIMPYDPLDAVGYVWRLRLIDLLTIIVLVGGWLVMAIVLLSDYGKQAAKRRLLKRVAIVTGSELGLMALGYLLQLIAP
jgi:hypothetical protein